MKGRTEMHVQIDKQKDVVATMHEGTKVYGKGDTEVRALNGVDIEIRNGEFTAIMGPSGSGKSTLLQCLAGLDTLTSGEVVIDGQSLQKIKDKKLTQIRRDKVGFIFQAFNLVPTLSAMENILLPMTIAKHRVDKAWFKKVVDTLRLGDRLKHTPNELSGGQQQRVAAARALVSRPKIIFADEPSGNLDSKSGVELLKFMRAAVDNLGQAIVMVTHDPNAASYADRVVFLDDGKIVDEMKDPTAIKIFDRMKHLGA
jgi:putative ABC transport system ATP-binding protein